MVWICVSAYGLDLNAVKSMVMGMGAFEGHKRKECIATFLGLDRVIVIIVDLPSMNTLISKGSGFKNYDTFTVRSLDF